MEPAITAEIGCRTEHLMSHFDKLHRLVCHACIHVSDVWRVWSFLFTALISDYAVWLPLKERPDFQRF